MNSIYINKRFFREMNTEDEKKVKNVFATVNSWLQEWQKWDERGLYISKFEFRSKNRDAELIKLDNAVDEAFENVR